LAFLVGGIVLLALVSVATGAFVLPLLQKDAPPQPEKTVASAEPAAPTVYLPPVPEVATATRPIADLTKAPKEKPQPRPVKRSVVGPSPFDTPSVKPQVPNRDAAYALAEMIDREIDRPLKEAGLPASPLAGDAEFLRRAYLDLTGRIPPRDKASAFLLDADPTKRARLIDELLASKEHGVFFARIWADLLIKRDFDSNRGLKTGPFVNWLADQFNKNAGWDQIVRDMITATGPEESAPQTLFILANQDNRQPSPPKLVGAVGNLFMGIHIQCAECHQHPFTSKWGQNDFWGMAAFFGHTKADRGPMMKGKKANGPATIKEVERAMAPRDKKGAKTGPAIQAGLKIAVPDPNDPRKTVRIATGKFFEGRQAPATTRGPYRPHLAQWLTAPENRYFSGAAVNRVWAHFFARGLVNPIEDMNDANKPTHPELLRKLAEDFTASSYDLKKLMRAICNSSAYQRTSRPLPDNKTDERLYSHMPVKVMSAQQLIDSLEVVIGRDFPGVRPRPQAPPGKKGQGRIGGDVLVRSFDTREYDDDATEFSYGIPQLLRLMNTPLTNAGARMAQQLVSKYKDDHARAIQEIYLTALSRLPSEQEAARMADYVKKQSNGGSGYADVMWALLNCAEFISNR
jgi:hypothetical protein